MNTAIIVAAGYGSRFGSDIPKQFVELAGKPLIIHTLEKFEACPAIDEIILVLSEAGTESFKRISHGVSIAKLRQVVTGGETRAESVRNALHHVNPYTKIVAVHDGARPFVTTDEIERTVGKAAKVGAACLVAEVTDTIKEVDTGFELLRRTLDRTVLRRALTPQAFRLDILQHAFRDFDATATDECYLVERLDYDYDIGYVEGSSRNIKITRAEDLAIAEAILAASE